MPSLLTKVGPLARKGLVIVRRMVPASLRARLRPVSDWSVALWHRHVSPGFARRIKRYDPATMPEVSVLLITWNRLRMLREGLESLLQNTHGGNYEIIVWDNGSTDGTKEYLDDIAATRPELRVHHHPDNVGLNAVALAVGLARGYYIVELDDDVVRFPDDWLSKLLYAFKKVPQIGYMAANVVQDEFTTGEKDIPEGYTVVDYDGVVLEHGATWGWCSMTSLEVLSRIGNFPRRRGRLNFTEDEDYVRRCLRAGYTPAILQEVVVYHASGAAMNDHYGYLASCLKKYEETPQVTRKLQVAREYAQKTQNVSDTKE
jgi:GT2 family glycosyltransferase